MQPWEIPKVFTDQGCVCNGDEHFPNVPRTRTLEFILEWLFLGHPRNFSRRFKLETMQWEAHLSRFGGRSRQLQPTQVAKNSPIALCCSSLRYIFDLLNMPFTKKSTWEILTFRNRRFTLSPWQDWANHNTFYLFCEISEIGIECEIRSDSNTGTAKIILYSQKLKAPNSTCEQFSLVYDKEKFVISDFIIYVTTWEFKIFVCCSVPCFAVSAEKPSKMRALLSKWHIKHLPPFVFY